MKIFSDRAFLPSGARHVTALYPHWGLADDDPRYPGWGRYDRWLATGTRILELTPIHEADAAVFPGRWEDVVADTAPPAEALAIAAQARDADLPLLVFYCSDSDEPVRLDGAVVLRTSLRRSRHRASEHALPVWSEDLVEHYFAGSVPVRRRQPGRPVVGFCGSARRPTARDVARRALRRRTNPGDRVRNAALAQLDASPAVDTAFVRRSDFWAAASDLPEERRIGLLHATRQEFVDNLVASDYALCVRGNGNFSYRLYEALSIGRIPVFVDTDTALPFEDELPWRELCVWVDESELDSIGERVAAHYESVTDAGFVELQHACRNMWREWLSPVGFFSHLETLLPQHAA